MKKTIYLLSALTAIGHAAAAAEQGSTTTPNVVLIYADDLGYGDVGCYNPDSKIPTPNIDKLAENGMRFVDAHSPDSICSPSRYGILTGRYSWRTSTKSGNPKPGEQPWINEGRIALPAMLQEQGYDTAVFGKWGLGADWRAAAKPERKGIDVSVKAIDYSKTIYSGKPFGFNHEEVHLWYGRDYFRKQYPSNKKPGAYEKDDGGRWYFKNGVSRGGDPDFAAFDMEVAQMHYIQRTVQYIDAKGKNEEEQDDFILQKNAPFFIYYAPHIPHYPHVPAPQFQGKTGMGVYGDFIYELDWAVGQIVEALKRNGMLDNTMIIFSSDNGPEGQSYDYITHNDHHSAGSLRGIKRDLWEGGHRTPFILSWPGIVPSGTVSDRFISQTDIYATLAHTLDVPLPHNAAEDSFSFLDELTTPKKPMPKRELAVYHSPSNQYALRHGSWVFVNAASGGYREPKWWRKDNGVVAHSDRYELFNLAEDPGQKVNLYSKYPEKAKQLSELLKQVIKNGRTRN